MDLKGKRKADDEVQSCLKKQRIAESSQDLNSQRIYPNNENVLDSCKAAQKECLMKKLKDFKEILKNKPKSIRYKNAFELYKSDPPNEKHSIKTLDQWNCVTGWRHVVYENEFKELKRQYKKKLARFLKSLSEDELIIYDTLRFVNRTTVKKHAKNENNQLSNSEDDRGN